MQTFYSSSTNGLGGDTGSLQRSDSSLTTTSLTTQTAQGASHSHSSTYLREGLSAFSGILLLTGLLLMLRRANSQRKADQGGVKGSLEGNRVTIPCQNCHYFHPNTFMPCAVNPSLALRKEAVNCSDYCPRRADSVTKSVYN